ncbi:hypothetical protein J6590_079476 [Homalodisca vitripennis]|nr:hypothetical protein J6590_079476 [Homalodisca vitripennis]
MESMSLVEAGDGVSDEVECDKTDDEAAFVTLQGGETVSLETDNETVDVWEEDKLVGFQADDEHCDDRCLKVTGCGPVCLPPLTIMDLMSRSVFKEAPQFPLETAPSNMPDFQNIVCIFIHYKEYGSSELSYFQV